MPDDNRNSAANFAQKQGGSLANLGAPPSYTGAPAVAGSPQMQQGSLQSLGAQNRPQMPGQMAQGAGMRPGMPQQPGMRPGMPQQAQGMPQQPGMPAGRPPLTPQQQRQMQMVQQRKQMQKRQQMQRQQQMQQMMQQRQRGGNLRNLGGGMDRPAIQPYNR